MKKLICTFLASALCWASHPVHAQTLSLECSLEYEPGRGEITSLSVDLGSASATVKSATLGSVMENLPATISSQQIVIRMVSQEPETAPGQMPGFVWEYRLHRPTATVAFSTMIDTNLFPEAIRSQAAAMFSSPPDENGIIVQYSTYGACHSSYEELLSTGAIDEIVAALRIAAPTALWDAEPAPDSVLGVWGGFPVTEEEGVSIERQLLITQDSVTSKAICTEDGTATWARARSEATIDGNRIRIKNDSSQRDRSMFYCYTALESGEIEYRVDGHDLTLRYPDGTTLTLARYP